MKMRTKIAAAAVVLLAGGSAVATTVASSPAQANATGNVRFQRETSVGALYVQDITKHTQCRFSWRKGETGNGNQSVVLGDGVGMLAGQPFAACDLLTVRYTNAANQLVIRSTSPTMSISDSAIPANRGQQSVLVTDVKPGTDVVMLACAHGTEFPTIGRWMKVQLRPDGEPWLRGGFNSVGGTSGVSLGGIGQAGNFCPITAINSDSTSTTDVTAGAMPGPFASDPRSPNFASQVESAIPPATLTGTASLVTFGSNFKGTGWAQNFSAGNSVTWPQTTGQRCDESGANYSQQTTAWTFRMTLPFQAVNTGLGQSLNFSTHGQGTRSLIVPPSTTLQSYLIHENFTEQYDLKATPVPGGDWTNWSTPVYFTASCAGGTNTSVPAGITSGWQNFPIDSITLTRNSGGSGFNVDQVWALSA